MFYNISLVVLSLVLTHVKAFDDGTARNSTDSDNGDSSISGVTLSSAGSIILLILIVLLCYYCCCRNRNPSRGFSELNNEGDSSGPNNEHPSRPRRFFRRYRRNRSRQNQQDPQPQPQVIIQPIVSIGIPPQNLPNMPAAAVPTSPPYPSAPPHVVSHAPPPMQAPPSVAMQAPPPPYDDRLFNNHPAYDNFARHGQFDPNRGRKY